LQADFFAENDTILTKMGERFKKHINPIDKLGINFYILGKKENVL